MRMRRRVTVRAVATMEAVPAVVPLEVALRTVVPALGVEAAVTVNFVPVLREEEVVAGHRRAIAVGMDAAIHAVAEVTVGVIAIVIKRRDRSLLHSLSD
jgi:hypothetical protein